MHVVASVQARAKADHALRSVDSSVKGAFRHARIHDYWRL